jgi:hypothetical protein
MQRATSGTMVVAPTKGREAQSPKELHMCRIPLQHDFQKLQRMKNLPKWMTMPSSLQCHWWFMGRWAFDFVGVGQ